MLYINTALLHQAKAEFPIQHVTSINVRCLCGDFFATFMREKQNVYVHFNCATMLYVSSAHTKRFIFISKERRKQNHTIFVEFCCCFFLLFCCCWCWCFFMYSFHVMFRTPMKNLCAATKQIWIKSNAQCFGRAELKRKREYDRIIKSIWFVWKYIKLWMAVFCSTFGVFA